jgi:hypothetical protein
MNHLDLNIEHYQLNDLLDLFKISSDFDENDLKKAKKMVLQTHPDKSQLPPDYFLFFSKAYKMLYGIWEFKNKQSKDPAQFEDLDYKKNNEFMDREKKQVLQRFLSKNQLNKAENFNQWFNTQFEKNKMESEEQTYGYGDWLRSDEDLDQQKDIHHTQLGEEIEKKKKQLRALIVHQDISELNSFLNMGATNLAGEAPDSYSSDLFSQLPYEDLRKAHTETVIPVTMEDYQSVQKFNDVNEYKRHRGRQDTTPLSEKQAQEYLKNKNRIQDRETTERAYHLAKQMEESKAKQDLYWASMKYLSDK